MKNRVRALLLADEARYRRRHNAELTAHYIRTHYPPNEWEERILDASEHVSKSYGRLVRHFLIHQRGARG